MRRNGLASTITALILGGIIGYWVHGRPAAPQVAASGYDTSAARGEQLALLGGCDDCHTPTLADGRPDMSRRFSGHPAGTALPPDLPGVVTNLNQAWRGPWGLSTTRNISSDPVNGIGSWTLDQFIHSMRTATNPSGKAIQPPMPVANYGRLSDADLTALYNFLRTVKPNPNPVTGP